MTNYKEQVQGLLLEDLYELCYRAHSNTSFSPEKRAVSYVTDYSQQLEDDLQKLGENQGNYQEKFIAKFSAWMSAKGNCISSMITGPANFPIRKAEKANRAEQNKYNDFVHWRDNYFTEVNRVPTKSPEDELTLAEKRQEELANFQIELKELNAELKKMYKKAKKDEVTLSKQEVLDSLQFKEYSIKALKELSEHNGFYYVADFTLRNNNAKLKGVKDKVTIMTNRIERKNAWEDIIFEGGRVTIEDDRVKIIHDEKPTKEIIEEIKRGGYRWSPFWKCWCRKHTGNAIFGLKYLSFLK